MTWGSRFADGGYQAPATNSAKLERGKPTKEQRWTIGGVEVLLRITPLIGGRPGLLELELHTNDPVRRHTTYTPCMLRGGELALEAFKRTAERLDAGEIPDAVLLPPGAPLGW